MRIYYVRTIVGTLVRFEVRPSRCVVKTTLRNTHSFFVFDIEFKHVKKLVCFSYSVLPPVTVSQAHVIMIKKLVLHSDRCHAQLN